MKSLLYALVCATLIIGFVPALPVQAVTKINLANSPNLVGIGAPEKLWDKTFGGTAVDRAYCVRQTTDGGYIFTGETESYGLGGGDIWLVKTDASGIKQWDKTFGGTNLDIGHSVRQTSDGGYVITGVTNVYGFVPGDAPLYGDVILIKTDAFGNQQWSKSFGGSNYDEGWSVVQTADGGYIIAGGTRSFGAGWFDFWLIKTDASGNQQWDKVFGGWDGDKAASVQQTNDGGYIITGYTYNYGAGSSDVWLIKTDASGTKQWDKTFGGSGGDTANYVQQASDGGYIITGQTYSYGAGSSDVWLIKTDASGTKQWDKTFGGVNHDEGYSVQQTNDGGYIVAGTTMSFGAGGIDIYLVKTDTTGNEIWHQTLGGTGDDEASSVQQTADNGYIVAGSTKSYGAGGEDAWLIKLKPEISVPFFSQRDPQWKDNLIGTSGKSIGQIGCAMTSCAMLLKYYGVDNDPGILNDWLSIPENNGYDLDGYIDFLKPAEYSNGKMQLVSRGGSLADNDNWTVLNNELSQGYPVIVQVDANPSTAALDGHWVVVTGKIGNDYYINDPWDFPDSSLDISPNNLLSDFHDKVYDNTFFKWIVYHGDITPPDCLIQFRKQNTTTSIDQIGIGGSFDIFIGDSTDNIGITGVRFSSDDSQDGISQGAWTKWYDWNVSSGDWNAETKVKTWLFGTGGIKEVWAEVKDGATNSDFNYQNISAVPIWRQDIQVGDLLLSRTPSPLSRTISALGSSFWTHVGIYIGDGKVIEALFGIEPLGLGKGVQETDITTWDYPNKTCVELLRVANTNVNIRNSVRDFVIQQKGDSYELHAGKSSNPNSDWWYCSELAWAAYYNQGIDIEYTPDPWIVSPQEINDDEDTIEISNHMEHIPTASELLPPNSFPLELLLACPANIVVTDPNGLIISHETNQINDAFYITDDFDNDGDPEHCVSILNRKAGDYLINIVPDIGALPTDTYSVYVQLNGQLYTLAENVLISDIPSQPYVFTVESEEPTPPPGPAPNPEVGGDIYPVSKAAMLAPWLVLTVILTAGVIIAFKRRRTQSKNRRI